MLSGNFKSALIDSITIPERQRKDLGDVRHLAQSMAKDGQLNPIVITPEHVLVAGERRLTAAKLLGWSHIYIHYSNELTPAEFHRIELEENLRRKDLEWKERCNAIADYHNLMLRENKEWTVAQTAKDLDVDPAHIRQNIAVSEALRLDVPLVRDADKFSVARGIVERHTARARANQLDAVDTVVDGGSAPTSQPATISGTSSEEQQGTIPLNDGDVTRDNDDRLLNCTFEDWVAGLIESNVTLPYNFIHCDFPYGINYNKHNGGAADKFGGYSDTVEDYFGLLNFFVDHLDLFCAQSAHLMFWFSMDYYDDTRTTLERAGFVVNPFPLIWFRSDNSGILPDPKRGPRRNYETAFLCSRGDRPIVQAVSNVSAQPNTKEIHTSEKPRDMLAHFFRMFVDEHSRVFDPTAGSANALRVAESMGAKSVFGLERDPEYHARALENWK